MEKNNDSSAQAVEQKTLVKNDSLNLVTVAEQPTGDVRNQPSKDTVAQCKDTLKAFPTVDLYDSGSAQAAAVTEAKYDAYKAAIAKTLKPAGEHKSSPLDQFSLASTKLDPLAACFDANGFPVISRQAQAKIRSSN